MKKLDFQAVLPVTFLREDGQFVAYSPALDLSTCGDSFERAQERFAEVAQLFFEEAHKMGTLEDVLLDLGWTKKDRQLTPPVVVAQESQMVSIPMPA